MYYRLCMYLSSHVHRLLQGQRDVGELMEPCNMKRLVSYGQLPKLNCWPVWHNHYEISSSYLAGKFIGFNGAKSQIKKHSLTKVFRQKPLLWFLQHLSIVKHLLVSTTIVQHLLVFSSIVQYLEYARNNFQPYPSSPSRTSFKGLWRTKIGYILEFFHIHFQAKMHQNQQSNHTHYTSLGYWLRKPLSTYLYINLDAKLKVV